MDFHVAEFFIGFILGDLFAAILIYWRIRRAEKLRLPDEVLLSVLRKAANIPDSDKE